MHSIINAFKQKNIVCGYLYFYIHCITEIGCFYFLSKVTNGSNIIWLIPLIYDGLAFIPQSLIGYINDKKQKINFGIIGTALMFLSFVMYFMINMNLILSLVVLCLGNACLHISGAEATLRTSEGKLSHSAIFVSGGSFGVITGKLLAGIAIPFWSIMLLILTMIPFILLANTYRNKNSNCSNFDYIDKSINPWIIILLAVLVVIIRGYMGYGIPTTWNKTTIQAILFYFTMGFGKALGGIISDAFGIRKTVIISTVLSIPFLCFGDNVMIISLIGIMLFSMTMAITLGILVSALKDTPGLAFGLTTIGLTLGTFSIFFVNITDNIINISMIISMSLICTVILLKLLKKNDKNIEKEGVKYELDLQ